MQNNVAIKLYIIHTGSTNWILDKFTVATTLAAIRTTVLVSKYFGKSLFFTLLKTCMFHTWTFIKKKLYLYCPWTSYDDNDNPVYFSYSLIILGVLRTTIPKRYLEQHFVHKQIEHECSNQELYLIVQ